MTWWPIFKIIFNFRLSEFRFLTRLVKTKAKLGKNIVPINIKVKFTSDVVSGFVNGTFIRFSDSFLKSRRPQNIKSLLSHSWTDSSWIFDPRKNIKIFKNRLKEFQILDYQTNHFISEIQYLFVSSLFSRISNKNY